MFREFTVPKKLGNGISEALNTTRSVAVASIFLSSMRAYARLRDTEISSFSLFISKLNSQLLLNKSLFTPK